MNQMVSAVTAALLDEPFVGMKFVLKHSEDIFMAEHEGDLCVVTHLGTDGLTFAPDLGIDKDFFYFTVEGSEKRTRYPRGWACWLRKCWRDSIVLDDQSLESKR
jgi:hypothetical protein